MPKEKVLPERGQWRELNGCNILKWLFWESKSVVVLISNKFLPKKNVWKTEERWPRVHIPSLQNGFRVIHYFPSTHESSKSPSYVLTILSARKSGKKKKAGKKKEEQSHQTAMLTLQGRVSCPAATQKQHEPGIEQWKRWNRRTDSWFEETGCFVRCPLMRAV